MNYRDLLSLMQLNSFLYEWYVGDSPRHNHKAGDLFKVYSNSSVMGSGK